MSRDLTRYAVAEEVLRSIRIGTLQSATSVRQDWRERLFRGFRPNKISRSVALTRSRWFAADASYLAQLLDVYLDDFSIPGAFADRLSAASENARVPPGLRELLADMSSFDDLAALPAGIDMSDQSDDPAQEDKPSDDPPELRRAESSASEHISFERESFEWAPTQDDVGLVQDAVTLFERNLSAFIENRLRRIHGTDWLKIGCSSYKRRWSDKAGKETGPPPESQLGYAEIGELGEIIVTKRNWPVFRPYFESKTWVESQFSFIVPLRTAGFHPGARKIFAPERSAAFAAMSRVASCYHSETAEEIDRLWSADEVDESDPENEVALTSERILKNFDSLPRPSIVGRDQELRELHEFWDDEFARAISITGRGGLGKTALVYEFVADLLRVPVYPGVDAELDLIIFLTAKQTWAEQDDQQKLPDRQRFGTLREAFEATLDILDEVPEPDDEMPVLRRKVLELARANQCLFVFDNLETLDDEEIGAVAEFCQEIPLPSKAIVTDRERRGTGIGRQMILPGLSHDASLRLIEGRLDAQGAKLPARGTAALESVIGELGGVPLYLHFLANLLTEGHPPAEALRVIRGSETLGLLRFSFESSLTRLSGSALELLYYMSLKREPASRKELLRLSDPDSEFSEEIGALQDAHFVEYAQGREAIAFRVADRTLAEYVRHEAPSRMDGDTILRLRQQAGFRGELERQPNVERAIRQAMDEASKLDWAQGVNYLEQKCAEFRDPPPLVGRLGYFYFRNHDRQQARLFLERALSGDWEDALTLRTLGILNLWDGHLQEAQANAEAALSLRPEEDQAKLLLGEVLMRQVERARFTLDDARRLELARKALGLIEDSFIEDDYARWQRGHNERRERLLTRCELLLVGTRRGT